ncbi:MAG: hypothetical protein RSB20_06845, partial [Clostridia bacterium]
NQSSNFKYLIIPELHELKIGEEKAAIHFHGVVSGIRECDVKFIKNSKKYHNSVYSFLPMYNRFGTTNLIPIKNQTENVTYYICKYICKAGRLLKKSFYASNGLKTSEEVLNSDSNNMLIPNLNTLISNGFSPSYCSSFCTIYDIPAELIPILDNTIDIVEDISKYVQQYKLTGDINEFTQFQKQLE